jgi:hypothetical protein
MEQKWEVGPITVGNPIAHLAKGGQHAECKPYTQEDLAWVYAVVYAPGFGNALTARLLDAEIAPANLCAECFPVTFRDNYARVFARRQETRI